MKKRKLEAEASGKLDGAGPKKRPKTAENEVGAGNMKIQPGESLGHFNRCVYSFNYFVYAR